MPDKTSVTISGNGTHAQGRRITGTTKASEFVNVDDAVDLKYLWQDGGWKEISRAFTIDHRGGIASKSHQQIDQTFDMSGMMSGTNSRTVDVDSWSRYKTVEAGIPSKFTFDRERSGHTKTDVVHSSSWSNPSMGGTVGLPILRRDVVVRCGGVDLR